MGKETFMERGVLLPTGGYTVIGNVREGTNYIEVPLANIKCKLERLVTLDRQLGESSGRTGSLLLTEGSHSQLDRSHEGYIGDSILPGVRSSATLRSHLLPFWKATEFRSFFHYISIIIYKDFMYEDAFKHNLLYFSSITIFSTTAHRSNWALAGRILKLFVKTFKFHYGRSNLVSNVHNLLYVYRDVMIHGPLDIFSAFCFENHLQFLNPHRVKRCVTSGNRCLEQVASRSRDFASIHKATSIRCSDTYPKLTKTAIGIQLTKIFLLMPNMKDQWFMTRSFGIVKFLKVHKNPDGSFMLIGKLFNNKEELFEIDTADDTGPIRFSSSILHMYKVNVNTPVRMVKIACTAVLCKLVCVPLPHRSLSRYKFDPNQKQTSSPAVAINVSAGAENAGYL
ncbi:uncharacterized protein LOC126575414 [Anopheles aquasalis]|uniref:uncharacterized protein LOC126575414 n=1 Tax=Anopheles aquasalis TaxID=42839 RepID=UPI00215ACA97|nr:uncharacterized protein LOC126575414 [Anopheles aquasalis]